MTSASSGTTGPHAPAPVGSVVEVRPIETFEAFYRRELPSLIAFAGVLSGSASADDIAQEAMLAAYRRWDDVSRLDVPAAWVRRVCANRAISTLRRRAVEARAVLRLGGRREPGEPLADDHEAFWGEVRQLSRRQAQVVALHYIYDLGVPEIATTLGCAEGTVKMHLSRGRAALAVRLRQSAEELS
jgi:RNA polymerase sigma factor (sigma-70 family)